MDNRLHLHNEVVKNEDSETIDTSDRETLQFINVACNKVKEMRDKCKEYSEKLVKVEDVVGFQSTKDGYEASIETLS